MVAALERSCPRQVQLPEVLVFFSQVTVLEIVVHAMGRQSGRLRVGLQGAGLPQHSAQWYASPVCTPTTATSKATTCCAAQCQTWCTYLVRLSHA